MRIAARDIDVDIFAGIQSIDDTLEAFQLLYLVEHDVVEALSVLHALGHIGLKGLWIA